MSNNIVTKPYRSHDFRQRPRFLLPVELIIDPNEPDWDYDMSCVAEAALKQLDIVDPSDDRRRPWDRGRRKLPINGNHLLACDLDTASCAQEPIVYLSGKEHSLLKKSGGTPTRKSSNKKYQKVRKSKGHEVEALPDDGDGDPCRPAFLTRAENQASLRKTSSRCAKQSPFLVTIPKMEPMSEMALPEAESCSGFDSFYISMRGDASLLRGGRSQSPDSQAYGCTPTFIHAPNSDAQMHAHPKHSFDSSTRRAHISPTSVMHTSSTLSDSSSRTEIWELKRELKSLKRLATMSSPTVPVKTRQVVRFAHPLVTALKHRPKTLPEEVSSLFFDQDELTTLEEEREARVYEEQVECVAISSGANNQLSISVSFPNTRMLSKRQGIIANEKDDFSPLAKEIQTMPRTSREI